MPLTILQAVRFQAAQLKAAGAVGVVGAETAAEVRSEVAGVEEFELSTLAVAISCHQRWDVTAPQNSGRRSYGEE